MSVPSDLPGSDWRRTPQGRALSLVWIALFAIGLASALWRDGAPWAWACGAVAVVAWTAYVLLPARALALRPVLELVLVVAGGLVAIPTHLVGAVAVGAGVALGIRRPDRRGWPAVVVVAALLASAAGLLLDPRSADRGWYALALLGVVAIAILLGFVRRQAVAVQERSLELVAERDRTARLDDHARVARDLHDVLAHGLGGLVVQLDAVDALLDSGRTAEAQARVRAAQALARDGLADARRAVDALRADADAPPVDAAALAAQLAELTEAHRALGGDLEARIELGAAPIPAEAALAVRRALQEALSNARKHAPGQRVAVRVARDGDRIRLSVENPVGRPSELTATGGRHGLAGMRERFDRLDGGRVDAGEADGVFRVRAEALLGSEPR